MAADLEEMREVSFRLKTTSELPAFHVGLRHAAQGKESRVLVNPYVSEPDGSGWRQVNIPLSVFTNNGLPNLSIMDTLFLMFLHDEDGTSGRLLFDDVSFNREHCFAQIYDPAQEPSPGNLFGGNFHTHHDGAAAISTRQLWSDNTFRADGGQVIQITFGGNIGLDLGKEGFSFAQWETDLLGFDASAYDLLVIEMRGQEGGERPNIYLSDGTNRRPVLAEEISALTTLWNKVQIPMDHFAEQGVDLTHLESLQLSFEWEEMSGTIYLGNFYFEKSSPHHQVTYLTGK